MSTNMKMINDKNHNRTLLRTLILVDHDQWQWISSYPWPEDIKENKYGLTVCFWHNNSNGIMWLYITRAHSVRMGNWRVSDLTPAVQFDRCLGRARVSSLNWIISPCNAWAVTSPIVQLIWMLRRVQCSFSPIIQLFITPLLQALWNEMTHHLQNALFWYFMFHQDNFCNCDCQSLAAYGW